MSIPSQVFPNKKCKGTDFSQVRGSLWKCNNCGSKITLGKKLPLKKKISDKPKKTVPKIDYKPLFLVCESCGNKIGVLNHPKDERGFNKTWNIHICREKTELYT